MKKEYTPDELQASTLTVKLQQHIVRDLTEMSKNTKLSVDEMVQTALKMFIATHNDYLGRRK